MKTSFAKTMTVALISLCFSLLPQVQADQIYSTVKDSLFSLTAIVQAPNGGTNMVRITNKDILAALNATGPFNFGSNAKLLLRSYNGELPYFVVRESSSNEVTTTDVSAYLTVAEVDYAVHGPDGMVNWSIWNVTLNGTGGTDFMLWGLTTLHTGAIPTAGGGDLTRTVALDMFGSGPGHISGANAQISGKLAAFGARVD